MAPTTSLTIENVHFPACVKPPGSTKTHFLGGAGFRGLEIEGNFKKFTAIGIYMEDEAVSALSVKWKGKSAQELMNSDEFFRDIVTGPFEKFTHATLLSPLTDAEAKAVEDFIQVFKDENLPRGSSILKTQSSRGTLTIAISKDGSIPEVGNAVIENKYLAGAILESIIGKNGVSPAARQSVAERFVELLKD
ncbi:hypothetical protein ACFE04_030548 [Oxalis oulophora]